MSAKMLWTALSILRIMWCLMPQSGYLHPDEFFQSPEIMAGDILDLDTNRPWEFLPTYPCRTVVIPFLTSGTAFWIVELLHRLDIKTSFSCSYILLVLPRLFITLLSFILDYTVYYIAPVWGSKRWKAMVLLAESYVTIIFYTRTISNAIEGIFFALVLLLTSLKQNSKANSQHFIGIVLAAGFFNRPTFACFAFIPIIHWAAKSNGPHFSYYLFMTKILSLLPSSLSTSILFIAADTLYFKGAFAFSTNSAQTLIEHITHNTVLTPLNFLRYNLNPDNLAQHGTHPPFTHVAVNAVVLFGILHVAVLVSSTKMLKKHILRLFRKHPSNNNKSKNYNDKQSLLLLIYYFPLAILSLFNHQEPRFLIPLLLPLVLLGASYDTTAKWTSVVVLFNVIGAVFFGCLQQAGLIPSLFHIQEMVQTKSTPNEHYTVLFTHTYMPPKYLLCLKKRQTYVDIIDLAGFNEVQLCQKIEEIKKDLLSLHVPPLKRHRLIIVFPGTLSGVVENCGFIHKGETVFAPHLSMEDPPTISQFLGVNIMNQLGLHVTEIYV
ncbi:GPI alpha-1,2-mannosyltransferase 4 [Pelodytes ibericus]